MLQDSPAPLKERIKKEKLYLCVVEGPLFSCGLFLGATIISLSRFPALRIACPFPFRPVVPSAPCFGVTLVNLHELSEGDCSLLCPRTSALPLSLLFKKWGSFTWYLTQCLYLSPSFSFPSTVCHGTSL